MRRPLPDPDADIDVAAVYEAGERPAPPGRPWLLLDMVTSIDGATAVDDHSKGLGGPGDQLVFHALRGLADIVLVAAGTVRAENYGPPASDPDVAERRRGRGQASRARLAIVSQRLDLQPDAKVFGDYDNRPVVITTTRADAGRKRQLATVADIVECGEHEVDLTAAVSALGDQGAHIVTAEGGPSLNGGLLDADLVDEVCVSLSPLLVGGDSARLVRGADERLHRFDLAHLLEDDGTLFARYVRRAVSGASGRSPS